MKKLKKENQHVSLQSKSGLLLQLGLIVALIVVYSLLEYQFTKLVPMPIAFTSINNEPDIYAFPSFEIEEKKKSSIKKDKIKPKLIDDFTIDEEKTDETDQVFINNVPSIDLDSVFSEVPIIEETLENSIPFVLVEQAPRYPGCTGKTELEYRQCFNKKINRFISKKFSPGANIGLTGKIKLFVLFEIDNTGEIIDINVKSPNKRLEKEAIKTIRKLPKMIPGKQRNIPVGVKYVLPISVFID